MIVNQFFNRYHLNDGLEKYIVMYTTKSHSLPISKTLIHTSQSHSWDIVSSKSLALNPSRQKFITFQDPLHHKIKLYNPMSNCKSAGVIPYTFHNGQLLFLFQSCDFPLNKKQMGWNDFGGKQLYDGESTFEVAAREFNEETSCLFYLSEMQDIITSASAMYEEFKHNDALQYDESSVEKLVQLFDEAQTYYANKITNYVLPIHISSKETYISYFVRVPYIEASDIPKAEDLHIYYETRYLRTCKWFSIQDIENLQDTDFHKRLQITHVRQRILKYHQKNIFS